MLLCEFVRLYLQYLRMKRERSELEQFMTSIALMFDQELEFTFLVIEVCLQEVLYESDVYPLQIAIYLIDAAIQLKDL